MGWIEGYERMTSGKFCAVAVGIQAKGNTFSHFIRHGSDMKRRTNMKHLEVEWRHLDKDGKTCERCSDTGKSVRSAYDSLVNELQPEGWKIDLKETLLSDREISESNNILLNGVPIEQLIANTRKSENCCASCGDLLGSSTMCRTLVRDGQIFEEIPAEFILEATRQIVQKQNR
jgi:hypothetical protein